MNEDENRVIRIWLRKLTGYVENGTSSAVTIAQDDATRDWFVKIREGNITMHAGSLSELIDMVGAIPYEN